MPHWPEDPTPPYPGGFDVPEESFHRTVYDQGEGGFHDDRWAYEAHSRGMDFGLLVVRLTCLPVLVHGVHQLRQMDEFTAAITAHPLGSGAPEFVAWMITFALLGLPVLLACGLFTRPAAFLLAMLVSMQWALQVLLATGYRPIADGVISGESLLLYAGMAIALIFTGAGRWSVDMMRTDGRP